MMRFRAAFLSQFPSLRLRVASGASPPNRDSIFAKRSVSAVQQYAVMSSKTSPSSHQTDAEYVTAYTTVTDENMANIIVNGVVPSKLVACVNIIPGVKSSYWWKGEVVTDNEMILLMKTRASLVDQLTAKIKEIHPYEVPALTILPIIAGNPEFLSWIGESTEQSKK